MYYRLHGCRSHQQLTYGSLTYYLSHITVIWTCRPPPISLGPPCNHLYTQILCNVCTSGSYKTLSHLRNMWILLLSQLKLWHRALQSYKDNTLMSVVCTTFILYRVSVYIYLILDTLYRLMWGSRVYIPVLTLA